MYDVVAVEPVAAGKSRTPFRQLRCRTHEKSVSRAIRLKYTQSRVKVRSGQGPASELGLEGMKNFRGCSRA